jgi:gamma-glutamylcyclotransferase (GGCT)/AIG2-like uncharacterized protein YtfP
MLIIFDDNMYYFAYGSNLKRDRLRDRVGAWSSEENCFLEGYRLTFDSRGKADIIEEVSSKVYGVIYGLSEQQMRALDTYEGVSNNVYRRSTVSVTVVAGRVDAVVYVKVNSSTFHVPNEQYLNFIIEGLAEHCFGQDIIDGVKRIANG